MMYQSLLIILLLNTVATIGAMKMIKGAKNLGNDEYRLTQGTGASVGAIWGETKVDISEDFEICADVYLGKEDDKGAAGIAFVVQGIGSHHSNLGSGYKMGYANINNVIAVEIDTYNNKKGRGKGLSNYQDIASDHVQLRYTDKNNGWFSLSGPVAIGGGNVEDDTYHKFKFKYTKNINTIEVYFDDDLKIQQKMEGSDITHYLKPYINNSGQGKFATIGFTGAEQTNEGNVQKVRLSEYDNQVCPANGAPAYKAGGGKTREKCTVSGATARWAGDPHFYTFDGMKYDCQGKGEFVVSKSLDSKFEVRGRFEEVDQKKVTVTRAVAFNTGGDDEPTVFLTVPENAASTCDITMYVNNEKYEIGGMDDIATVTKTRKRNRNYLTFEYINTGVSISVTSKKGNFGCVLGVQVCLPTSMTETQSFVGLLGTPNPTTSDWMLTDGTSKTIPTMKKSLAFGEAYEYCVTNWCVTDSTETMFYYEKNNNKNFEYYNGCTSKYDGTTEALYDNVSKEIEKTCDGEIDCIVESLVGGKEEAKDLAETNGGFDDLEDGTKPEDEEELPTVYQGGGAKKRGPNNSSGVKGDPHFKTWDGKLYDFHGICDLVLLHNPNFENGLGMDIHIRSKRTRQWSYVSRAVLKIRDNTFEISADKKRNEYWINGVLGKEDILFEDNTMLSVNIANIAGYQIQYRSVNSQQKEYIIDLGQGEKVTFKTWKEMVRIDFEGCTAKNFASSVGLMGTFTHSYKVGRDNSTIIENLNQFGQEWQVLPDEPKLFQTLEGPQAPSRCVIPSKTELRRRLSESGITVEEAAKACASITDKQDFDLCVFDIMATGDIGTAGVY